MNECYVETMVRGIPPVSPLPHYPATVINFPHSQEFMVSRIFSVVLIFLDPLMDEFTLYKTLP